MPIADEKQGVSDVAYATINQPAVGQNTYYSMPLADESPESSSQTTYAIPMDMGSSTTDDTLDGFGNEESAPAQSGRRDILRSGPFQLDG